MAQFRGVTPSVETNCYWHTKLRRFVAERRMEPNTVVVAVEKFRDVGAEMIQVAVFIRVDFL